MRGFSANDYDSQVCGASAKAELRYPFLDVNAFSAERVDNILDITPVAVPANLQ